MITTKVTQYRIVHHFNQDGKLAVHHIFYPQCKVFLFWHTYGQSKTHKGAIEQLLIHEHETKDKGFWGRLWEVWYTKVRTSNLMIRLLSKLVKKSSK